MMFGVKSVVASGKDDFLNSVLMHGVSGATNSLVPLPSHSGKSYFFQQFSNYLRASNLYLLTWLGSSQYQVLNQ